jgi:Holliday junction resolvase RusA-like endonuclease
MARSQSWAFTINLSPMGKQRVKATIRGAHAAVYTPSLTVAWEHFAAGELRDAWAGRPALAANAPLELEVLCVIARPKSLLFKFKRTGAYKHGTGRIWCTAKPDFDNAGKIVADAMQAAGILGDDKAICDGRVRKVYAAVGELPHVEIVLSEIDGTP